MLTLTGVMLSLLAAAQNVSPAAALQRRCELRIQAGDVAGGLADCGAAIAVDRSQASGFLVRGIQLWTLGRFADAYSDFSQVLARDPRHCQALAYRGAAALNMGEQPGVDMGDLDDALRCDPSSAFAHYTRGVAKMRSMQVHEAIDALTAAIRLAPQSPDAYEKRAICYEELHNVAAAARDRQRAEAIHGRRPR